MGATFSRVKDWGNETLTQADLDAEFDNILNNLTPSGVDDYSATSTQMRLTTDPGEAGTESLATSLAGELERIRFVIAEMKGSTAAQWYSTVNTSLTDLLTATGGSALAAFRISSGKASSNSSAPRFLVPSGSTLSVTLDAAPTNLVYYINGSQITATADMTLSGMLGADATAAANVCLVNDANLAGQEASKWRGEDGTEIPIDNIGTTIQSAINSYQAFKVVSGGLTEYFLGYVGTSAITNCLRGCFYDQNLAAIPRIPISDNNTIGLVKAGWLFANATGGIGVSYRNPVVSYATPSDTAAHWFDLGSTAWKTFTSSWNNASVSFVGVIVNTTSACVGARPANFFAAYSDYSNMQLDWISTTVIRQRNYGGKIAVGGALIDFKMTKPQWDISTDIESGYGESANHSYYAYVGENGQIRLSPEKPYFSQDQGRGWYHPYEVWRSVGYVKNVSSDFDKYSMYNYPADEKGTDRWLPCDDLRNIGMSATVNASAMLVTIHALDGSTLSPGNPGFASFRADQTAGTVVTRLFHSNLNMTVPSGATLGHKGGMAQYAWVYLTNNSGTLDCAIAGQVPFREANFQATTQLSGSSTASGILYSQGASAASIQVRYLGRITANNATAGSWVSAPTSIALRAPFEVNTESWGETVRSPSFVGISVTQHTNICRRVGDMLEVHGYVQAATSTAAGISITLPSGITVDSTKLVTPGPRNRVGVYYYLDNGAGVAFNSGNTTFDNAMGVFYADSSSALTSLYIGFRGVGKEFQQANASDVFRGGTSAMAYAFSIPVVGWSPYGP